MRKYGPKVRHSAQNREGSFVFWGVFTIKISDSSTARSCLPSLCGTRLGEYKVFCSVLGRKKGRKSRLLQVKILNKTVCWEESMKWFVWYFSPLSGPLQPVVQMKFPHKIHVFLWKLPNCQNDLSALMLYLNFPDPCAFRFLLFSVWHSFAHSYTKGTLNIPVPT